MTVLITGDLHRTDNPRDYYRHDFHGELCKFGDDFRVMSLVILGDLCEEKDEHSAWLVNKIVDDLIDLTRHFGRIYILRGNHDYLNPDWPFFKFVDRFHNITWINQPWFFHLPGHPGKCLFLPHTRDPEKEWKGLFKGERYARVFAHNTFDGAKSEQGRILRGINPAILKGQKVISGDVHVPQDGPITYVGAPYTIDFGDTYKPRVLLLDDDEVKSIPCKGPQKRLIEDQAPSDIKKGDIVKVRVHVTRKQFERWTSIKKEWTEWARRTQVTLYKVEPILQLHDRKPLRIDRKSVKSDGELLRDYARSQNMDTKTLKMGLNILEGNKQ